jgi:hypothetical protein
MACISLYTVRESLMKNFIARQDDSSPNSLWSKKCFRHVDRITGIFPAVYQGKKFVQRWGSNLRPPSDKQLSTQREEILREREVWMVVGGAGVGSDSDKGALSVAFSSNLYNYGRTTSCLLINRKFGIFSIKEPVEIIYCDSKQKGCFIT